MAAVNSSPLCDRNQAGADIHTCIKQVNDSKYCELEQIYFDLANIVQQHTGCNSPYCLKSSSDVTQYYRLMLTFKECKKKLILSNKR